MIISIIKTDKGLLKIYNKDTDWQCLFTGDVYCPELWVTRIESDEANSLQSCIDKVLQINNLQMLDVIK